MNVYLLTNIFEGKREVKGCFETSDAAYDFMAEKFDGAIRCDGYLYHKPVDPKKGYPVLFIETSEYTGEWHVIEIEVQPEVSN